MSGSKSSLRGMPRIGGAHEWKAGKWKVKRDALVNVFGMERQEVENGMKYEGANSS